MAEKHFDEENFSNRLTGKTALRILELAKEHYPLMAGFIVCIMITAFLEALNTFIVKHAIDNAVVPGDSVLLKHYFVLYSLLHLILAFSVFLFIYCAGRLGEIIQYDLRKKLFIHIQKLSFSYFDKTPVGWIISRMTSDISRISDLVTWNLMDIVWAVTNMTSALVFMLLINLKLALAVLCFIPVIIYTALKFQKYIIAEFRKVRSANSRITGAYNENIAGVKVIKALAREEKNLSIFGALTDDMYTASYRAIVLSSVFLPVVQLISSAAIATVLWFGGWQFRAGVFTVGSIQAFISYITFMLWPVQDIARVYAEMQKSLASAERVFSLLDRQPDIKDRKDSVTADSVKGDIEFDNVKFFYEEDDPVLENFSFKIKTGETVALVGPTGGGKSTIVNLLCRFYEPVEGCIRIGGRDYTEYTQHSLQSKLGVILQTPHLFSGTIMDNIRYGRLEASDDEVVEASAKAHADDFICRLPEGYFEEVGEEGTHLSTGQKQLISLARAILSRPEIIIMDEATSSIDTLSEEMIHRGMENLLKTTTAFVIAHRLSTIRDADRILYIDKGRILESGSHNQLLLLKGHYYSLYTRQFRKEKERDLHVFG